LSEPLNDQRREFFRKLSAPIRMAEKEFRQKRPPFPPYNNDPVLFELKCQKCNSPCLEECTEEIIRLDKDLKPYLDFSISGCNFCLKCAEVCPENVLDENIPGIIYAEIYITQDNCIAWQGVVCNTCKMACKEDAVILQGVLKPVIDEQKCTHCGYCVVPCPVEAVSIHSLVK